MGPHHRKHQSHILYWWSLARHKIRSAASRCHAEARSACVPRHTPRRRPTPSAQQGRSMHVQRATHSTASQRAVRSRPLAVSWDLEVQLGRSCLALNSYEVHYELHYVLLSHNVLHTARYDAFLQRGFFIMRHIVWYEVRNAFRMIAIMTSADLKYVVGIKRSAS